MASVEQILSEAMRQGASDIHLVPPLPPMFRKNTVLAPADGFQKMTPQETEQFVKDSIGKDRFDQFLKKRDVDFSICLRGLGRFRTNAHYQRNRIAISLRAICDSVPDIGELNLPPVVDALIDLPKGLILVTGPTGSGKSTTLASMISAMNRCYHHHIITLEDPVEYELRSDGCVIEQREVGIDVPNFASGLRHSLRQDPDVILVGEMRDLETTSAAITAAETGHLVLSTLHTSSAALTVERIIDIYPGSQQNQIRTMLANTLQAVISITLFQRYDTDGMIPACEVMLCTPAVRNCIRENRIHEIPNIIATNRQAGMCTMQDSISTLYSGGKIGREQAIARGANPKQLDAAMSA